MIDLSAGALFIVTYGLATTFAGLWLAWKSRQRAIGLAWVLAGIVSLAILFVFTTRLSDSIFQKRMVEVDLYHVLFARPHLAVTFIFIGLLFAARWLWNRNKRGSIALVGLTLFALLALFAPSTVERQLILDPILVSAALAGMGILAVSNARWAAAIPPLVSVAILAGLVYSTQHQFDVSLADQPRETGLTLPPNFEATVYAQLEEAPTAMAFDDRGALYVSTLNGSVLKLVDNDGDSISDQGASLLHALGWPLGLVWHEGRLYISASDPTQLNSGYILAADDTDGDGLIDHTERIIDGLPTSGYPTHQNNNLVIGPDERLYVGIGSLSDHAQETLPYAASIISFALDGSGLQVYATGVRNPYGLAFSADGRLFATDNGPDNLDETLLYVPPDELNWIVEGGDYGFPNYFGTPPLDSGTVAPIALFTMETVPTGLAVYQGSQFPAEFRDNIFVALWRKGGHPNGLGAPRYGQRIARITLEKIGDQWQSTDYNFITGLEAPIDVEESPDGTLYVADMNAARVYRISYNPP